MIFNFQISERIKMKKSKKMKKSEKMSVQECEEISLKELTQKATYVVNFMQIQIVGKDFPNNLEKILEIFLILHAAKINNLRNTIIDELALYKTAFKSQLRDLDKQQDENFLIRYYPRIVFRKMLGEYIEQRFETPAEAKKFFKTFIFKNRTIRFQSSHDENE